MANTPPIALRCAAQPRPATGHRQGLYIRNTPDRKVRGIVFYGAWQWTASPGLAEHPAILPSHGGAPRSGGLQLASPPARGSPRPFSNRTPPSPQGRGWCFRRSHPHRPPKQDPTQYHGTATDGSEVIGGGRSTWRVAGVQLPHLSVVRAPPETQKGRQQPGGYSRDDG